MTGCAAAAAGEPSSKLWGRVWYLPSLTVLGEQNARACYVGESICLTLTEESLGWWVGVMNELA